MTHRHVVVITGEGVNDTGATEVEPVVRVDEDLGDVHAAAS